LLRNPTSPRLRDLCKSREVFVLSEAEAWGRRQGGDECHLGLDVVPQLGFGGGGA
jgi:hypothetical protein